MKHGESSFTDHGGTSKYRCNMYTERWKLNALRPLSFMVPNFCQFPEIPKSPEGACPPGTLGPPQMLPTDPRQMTSVRNTTDRDRDVTLFAIWLISFLTYCILHVFFWFFIWLFVRLPITSVNRVALDFGKEEMRSYIKYCNALRGRCKYSSRSRCFLEFSIEASSQGRKFLRKHWGLEDWFTGRGRYCIYRLQYASFNVH